MKIYLIITYGNFHKGQTHRRVVGFETKLSAALDIVSHNSGDIHEDGYYPYVVIEEVGQGLYPILDGKTKRYWFRWVAGGYKRILEPSTFSGDYTLLIG